MTDAHPTSYDPLEDNRLRFVPGSASGHVESYFLKANDPTGTRALWVKLTVFSPTARPDEAVGEIWAISFHKGHDHVAVRETYPLRAGSLTTPVLAQNFGELILGPARLGPGFVWGAAKTGKNQIQWDLRFSTESRPLHPLPSELLYRGPIPNSKLLTPYPDELFEGVYVVNGENIDVSGWRGMQGHNWGGGHAFLYAWGHCNAFDDDESGPRATVFEGASAQVKVGPFGLITTPLLTMLCLRYRGQELRFTTLPTLMDRTAEVSPQRWQFRGRRGPYRLSGSAVAESSDMVGLYYPNPDGPMTHCLNSKLARLELELEGPQGLVRLRSQGRAALEIGTRDPDHGIRMYV